MTTKATNEILDAMDETFMTTTRNVLVFKKVYRKNGNPAVALLEIPKNTQIFVGCRRHSGSMWSSRDAYRKCRAERAVVHGFFTLDEKPLLVNSTQSEFDPSFNYRLGETVTPLGGFSTNSEECEPGIHFFATFEEARAYDG